MKKNIKHFILACILFASIPLHAQRLDVSVINIGGNVVRIVGNAATDFSTAPNNSWGSMNLTWRIPKNVAIPAPTVAPPAITPEVTNESTAFTGASPRDAFNNAGLDLTMFDLTTFGETDDGFWYFQVTGTTGNVQNIPLGTDVLLYEFTVPVAWACSGCVRLLTTDVPALMLHGISTTSFIDNITATGPVDVLNVVVNNAPLPLRFMNFDAIRNRSTVDLTWKVAEENNVRGYYVERSADGITWSSIGFVPAHAPAPVNVYTYTDNAPYKGQNYYRIREVDNDGQVMYSAIRKVKIDENMMTVELYPIPVNDILNIRMYAVRAEKAELRITDMKGSLMYRQTLSVQAGQMIVPVQVSNFASGVYVVEVRGSSVEWHGKFVKQ